MGTQNPILDGFLRRLTQEGRVLVLGGLAVIAHGLSRATKDADIWLEPFSDGKEWADRLIRVCMDFPNITIHCLPRWNKVPVEQLPLVIEDMGMVRILGLECPLDIFRRPNNFGEEEFNETFSRATPDKDGTWLPDPLDLIISKEATQRDRDRNDIMFLEGKVRSDFARRLETCTPSEAKEHFARYADHVVAGAALRNPDPAVQKIGLDLLREIAADGNPFAQDILRENGFAAD